MDYLENLKGMWTEFGAIDWESPNFNYDKAYACAYLSKLAYLRIPEFELKNADRINIIPCEDYRKIFQDRVTPNFNALRRSTDSEVYYVERPYAVAAITKIAKTVFIAIRGTHNLYDWKVNLTVRKISPNTSRTDRVLFHKGFYRAIMSCRQEIFDYISEKHKDCKSLIVTGHSLGGALAAIYNSVFSDVHYPPFEIGMHFNRQNLASKSCFTFGMPRYGNIYAMLHRRIPFHLYNEFDIVPTIPPRFLGYEDCFNEICIDDNSQIKNNHIKATSGMRWVTDMLNHHGIAQHDIELYIKRIEMIRSSFSANKELNPVS